MEPQTGYTYSANQSGGPSRARRLLMVVVLFVVVGAILVGAQMYFTQSQFRMTGTDPLLTNVSYLSPSINATFNRTLSSKNISVTSSPSIVSSTSVKDKTLTIGFGSSKTLEANKTYTITIKSISDSSGKQLTNQVLKFTAKNIAYNKLSKQQQATVDTSRQQYIYSKSSIDFSGDTVFLDDGMTAQQVEATRTAYFNFSQQINKRFGTVDINTNSIVNSTPDATTTTLNYTTVIDGTNYSTRLDFTASTIELYIYDADGGQIFDSGAIDVSAS